MKTIKIFTILIVSAIMFVSCQDEEDGTPRQISQEYTYIQNLRGSAGVKGELPLPDLVLADIVGEEIARNLTEAELQLADSYFEISGLNRIDSPDTVAVVLEDFTIEVDSNPAVNLGDCTTNAQGMDEFPSDEEHSGNQFITLIQDIFDNVSTGNKRANISVSFTPNVDITASDSVQLKIHFGARYHYLEQE